MEVEVISGESIEVRQWICSVDGREKTVVDRVDSETKNDNIYREGGIRDYGIDDDETP